MSVRELAIVAYVGKSTVSSLENARMHPSVEMAGHLDQVLGADGVLAGMVSESPSPDPDDVDRIRYALAKPTRMDGQTVDALAGVLAAHRRLDDTMGAHILLPAVDLEWRAVSELARAARGPVASRLHHVAAEWSQFVGWLNAESRHDLDAVRILTEAAEQADALDDGVLAAQVENFRGYLERQRGNPRGIVRHFVAAYRTPGASTLQRVGDAVQAAHGYALLGDRREAEQLLSEASDLTEQAETEDAPAAAYWLTPSFSRMGIGLAHLAMGNKPEAADNLRAGLASLDNPDAEWAEEYRQALVEAVQ